MKSDNYIIYKAKNIVNGMVYVGATTKSVIEREQDHVNKAKNDSSLPFHNAILTFGIEAFEWNQEDTAQNPNDLAKKEKEYIIKYNSKSEGYNSDSGGGFKKMVYQYNTEDGSLVGAYNSLEEAGEVVKTTKQHISRACLSVNKIYKGFYWSYDYTEPFIPDKDCRKKKVIFYNFKNETIQEFESVAEASRVIGTYKSTIAKYCRGERIPSNEFCWEYE